MPGGGMLSEPMRVMFVYWGRRGALSRFTHEVGRAALTMPNVRATISVSRQNQGFARYEEFGKALFPIDTFSSPLGAITQAWRIPLIRMRLTAHLIEHRTQAVIDLMPHIWGPLVVPAIKAAGIRYVPIVHDADMHPGDHRSNWARQLLDRSIDQANVILTLSQAVAGRLEAQGKVSHAKVFTLHHPDLDYGAASRHEPPHPGEPLRLLFLGRILPYKGLPLLLDAVDLLRDQGHRVELGVYGQGELGACAARLADMRAEVVNRWITDAEITAILPRFHAMVLSHTEASQSGVAATAFGAGLPVVATPVGGLIEQVQDGLTGTLAFRADAQALAEAIQRLLLDPTLYSTICHHLIASKNERSMTRFVEDCISHAFYAREPTSGMPARF